MARKSKNRESRPYEASDESDQQPSDAILANDDRVLDAVDSNTQLLQKIQAQLDGLCEGIVSQLYHSPMAGSADVTSVESDKTNQLRDQIDDLQAKLEEREKQNADLAAQLAAASVANSVRTSSETDETLSWEDRKQLILRQMEEDDFDSDDFEDSLSQNPGLQLNAAETPAAYVQRVTAELMRREKEISDLQYLLEQQSESRDAGVSIGAAGIASLIESDELIRQERERLQQLQVEWEEKFRQSEIEASLERARLSRERRELVDKHNQLDNELESLRLKKLQVSEKGEPRRWLSQLGLSTS